MFRRILQLGFFLVAFVVALSFLRVKLRETLDSYFRGDTLKTPDLVGINFERAKQSLQGTLKLKIARVAYHPSLPKGAILSQVPAPGIHVRKGKTMFLKVSRGADLQTVPDLIGLDLRKATIQVRNLGLQPGAICRVRDPEAKTGSILLQTPAPGEPLGRGGKVDFLVSQKTQSGQGLLPRVTGLSLAQAREVLRQAGLLRVHSIEVPSAVARDQVFSQTPPAGTFYEEETAILLKTHGGPELSQEQKTLQLVFSIPPGLMERRLRMVVQDPDGARTVHDARHLPGEEVRVQARGRGQVRVSTYLGDHLVQEETY